MERTEHLEITRLSMSEPLQTQTGYCELLLVGLVMVGMLMGRLEELLERREPLQDRQAGQAAQQVLLGQWEFRPRLV